MKKILIIEDEEGVQITLEDRLSVEGYSVTIKSDGLRGEEEAKSGVYDLIILDIMLPGRDGFAVCRNLREEGCLTPILMLTARNTDLDIVMGLRQGADDYLKKPFEMNVLLARIEALLRRISRPYLQQGMKETGSFRFGAFLLDNTKGELYKDDDPIPLKTQEYRLLLYLVRHPGQVISRSTLLDKVWGYDSMSTTRTVDVHIARIRNKIGESGKSTHIFTVRGRGYKFIN